MLLLARGIGLIAWGSAAGSLATIAAVLLRRHMLVLKAARAARLCGLVGIAVPALVFATLFLSSRYGVRVLEFLVVGSDPSEKARYLGKSIAELMNGGALALVCSLPGACVLAIERWRTRRAGQLGAGR